MKKALYILGQLSDLDVDWLAQQGRRRELAAGTVLIAQDQITDTVHLVLDGTFSVRLTRAGGEEIARLGAGEILGELSFVDGSPASAAVVALEPCTVLSVPHAALHDRIAGDPAFASRFYHALALFLSDRLRTTVRRFERDSAGVAAPEDDDTDELNLELLGNVHLAGARFGRIVRAAERA